MSERLIEAIWNDASANATRVYEKRRDHTPAVMTTVGWLMDQDDDGVSLCNERYEEDGALVYRGHTFIPASLIRQIRVLT